MKKIQIIKFTITLFSIVLSISCSNEGTKKEFDNLRLLNKLFDSNEKSYSIILFNPSDCNICEDKVFKTIDKYETDSTKHVIFLLPEIRALAKDKWIKDNVVILKNYKVYFNSFLHNYYRNKYNKNEAGTFELVFDRYGNFSKLIDFK